MRILLSLGNIRFMVDVCEGFMVFTISYCAHEVYTRPSGWPPPVRIASSINQIRHVNLRRWLPFYSTPRSTSEHLYVCSFIILFIFGKLVNSVNYEMNTGEWITMIFGSDEAIHCKITLLICGLFIAGST